jgi:putative transposase
MARLPRLVVPGVAVHIVQRGNDRRACFREDSDYLVYLSQLGGLADNTQCALHAYCLMTNHVHLLLTPGDASACSTLMRAMGRRYVRYFNRRYGRTGTLWEGRFRSCLVDSAAYVLACYRYIELNPVRAGMVTVPSAYKWSSYAGNAGMRVDRLLTAHPEFTALSSDTKYRHATYRGLVEQGEATSFLAGIREATQSGHGLVGEALKARLLNDMGRHLQRRKPGPREKLRL